MKKWFAILMTTAMILGLSACGSSKTEVSSNTLPASSGQEQTSTGEQQTKPAGWPKKDITVVVGYSAGGDVDLNARTIAKYLKPLLGVNVVVVNTTGASGVNAIVEVCESNPDGYTALFAHNGCLATEAYGGSPVSVIDDFETSAGVLTDNTYVLVAAASTGFKSWADVVDYAKANPGKLNTVANANSNSWNIIGAIEQGAGIEFNKVEGGSSVTDRIVSCLAGDQEILYGNYNQLKDYVENGDFVFLGVISDDRSKTYPDLPTLTEQGCRVESIYDFGFRFPVGTDAQILDYFDRCLKQVCEDPAFIAEVEAMGPNVNYRTPAQWKDISIKTKADIIARG